MKLPQLPSLRSIPPVWRVASLVTLVLLVAFFGWLFFLRPSGGGGKAVLATPPSRPAIGKTVTLGDYRAAVAGALGEVQAAKASVVGSLERKQHLQAAASDLERVEGAGVVPQGAPSSAEAEIDNTAFIEALGSDEPNVDALESGLQVLSADLSAPANGYLPGTKQGNAALSELQSVLSDQTFNYRASQSLLDQLIQWLNGATNQASPDDTLTRLLTALMGGLAAGSLFFLASERLGNRLLRLGLSVLVGLFTAALLFLGLRALSTTAEILGVVGLLVAAVAVGVFVLGIGKGRTASSTPRTVSDLAAALGMNAGEARRRAEVSAGEGDFRAAIRYRCLGVLLALDEAGKLAFDRSATNREYLFRAAGPLHDELQPLLDRFDDVWYGGVPVAANDWQDYSARATHVEALAQVGEGGRRAA